MHSNLTNSVIPASESNYTQGRRGYTICKFTPHHMAGVLTGDQCARLFQRSGRGASSNYCIGNDGSLTCSVEEENRAWTSSSSWNDCQAITVEVSNSAYTRDWPISEAAWNTLVNLAEDVCRRYGFRLEYDGTKNGSLTTHDMYANTNCPGPTLKERLPELARLVNARLDNTEPEPVEEEEPETLSEFTTANSVLGVQRFINSKYGFGIVEDNKAGNQTKKALAKALQLELYTNYSKQIVIDGIIGNQTKNACPSITKGANNMLTWILQARLLCLGYAIVVDGDFGNQTLTYVKQFQRAKGTLQDGVVGPVTWGLLFN